MLRKKMILMVQFILIVSCAPGSNFIYKPIEETQINPGSTIGIYIEKIKKNKIAGLSPDDVNLFFRILAESMRKLNPQLSFVQFDSTDITELKFSTFDKKVDRKIDYSFTKDFKIRVPDKNNFKVNGNKFIDYILIVDEVLFGELNSFATRGTTYSSSGMTGTNEYKYLIWNYSENSAFACGLSKIGFREYDGFLKSAEWGNVESDAANFAEELTFKIFKKRKKFR